MKMANNMFYFRFKKAKIPPGRSPHTHRCKYPQTHTHRDAYMKTSKHGRD